MPDLLKINGYYSHYESHDFQLNLSSLQDKISSIPSRQVKEMLQKQG